MMSTIRNILIVGIGLLFMIPISGCEKYLNLDPPNDLSGNNFWKNKNDIEQYTNGLYQLFRQAIFRSNMTAPPGNDEFPFFVYSGDLRGAPFQASNFAKSFGRDYFPQLAANDIRSLTNPDIDGTYYSLFHHARFTQWDRFYKVIAGANIAVDRVDEIPGLSDADKARYKGEAVFLRNLTYFFMVRLWGDVPYYTEAYHSNPEPRTPMIEVLKNCTQDLMKYYEGLPWSYEDPAQVGVRAMRGSALVLDMQINMWLASFDMPNSKEHYQKAVDDGAELYGQDGKAYMLLPLEETHTIFKGRTKESLFEIPQNVNYGESFGWSAYSDNVLRAPYKHYTVTSSYIYYKEDFMRKLYPDGVPDKRKIFWFETDDMFKSDGSFLMLKFANVFANQNAEDANPDDNQTVFRLAGAYLLYAEAAAELGDENTARQMANIVRTRAGAPNITTSGKDLKDDIFYERCRELMGEGQYWYDVVRQRRIIDNEYKFGYHCTVQEYKDGAWTWPLSPNTRVNNPYVVLNEFWN